MRSLCIVVFLLLGTFTAGCFGDVVRCEQGTALVNSKECVPIECSIDPNVPCTDPVLARCNQETFLCEGCIEDDECAQFLPTPHCAATAGLCVECATDSHCGGATPACDDNRNVCVECTPQTETSDCGDTSCDPTSLTCTETERGSVGICHPCMTDSECGDGLGNESVEHRCIELFFDDVSQGGRCLKLVDEGGSPPCVAPYRVGITRESVSGAADAEYCGIRESLTTCEAVLKGADTVACTPATVTSDCAPQGALCEDFGLAGNLCTYPCTGGTQCPESKSLCEGGFCKEPLEM